MPASPKISVLTPCYQGASFIEECVENVASQGCDDIEHVVLDGDSTDETAAILARLAKRHPHLHWESARDRGQSDALNKGVRLARGDVLGILNVDDRYEQRVLPRIANLFTSLPVPSLVVGNCNLRNALGSIITVNRPRDLRLEALLIGDASLQYPWNPSSYFYHAALHSRVGLYDADDSSCMDLDFLLRAIPLSHVLYVDETWGNFLLHDQSKTQISIRAGTLERKKREVFKRHARSLPWTKRALLRLAWALQDHPRVWSRARWLRHVVAPGSS